MKNYVLFLVAYSVFVLACNNGTSSSVKAPLHDTLNEQAVKIKSSVDSAKGPLISVQAKTQQELDSLNRLLNNDAFMSTMGVAAYTDFKNEICERLSIAEKITRLQPLEQAFTDAFTAFNNEDHTALPGKEKLAKLDSTARVFEDSIRLTLDSINGGK